ncbi:MAG: GyrI-like domain-containing protein [Butyricicoccus sp.]
MSEAYGKITEWIGTEGYHIAGAPFELYRKTAFQQPPPDKWETEIFFPVVKRTEP